MVMFVAMSHGGSIIKEFCCMAIDSTDIIL